MMHVFLFFMLVPTSTGKCLSLDHTIKVANKATVVNPQKQCLHLIRALLSVINEYTEIMNWVRTMPASCLCSQKFDDPFQRLCPTRENAEITEVLEGLHVRHEKAGVEQPVTVTADNCCQIRAAVEAGMPGVIVVLDVFHFVSRYVSKHTLTPAVTYQNSITGTRRQYSADRTIRSKVPLEGIFVMRS